MDTKVEEESEELGFSYLSLLFNEGADSLRDELQSKLDREYKEKSLDEVIKDKEFKLKGLRPNVLFDEMRNLLFDEDKKPLSMQMFDISLTYVLIRNIVTSAFYGNPSDYEWRQAPTDAEIDKCHDIKRIKTFRNEASHSAKITMSKNEFKTKWKKLADTIVRLGGEKYVELIEKRKHTPVTADMKRSIKEKIERVAKRQAAEIMKNISNTLDISAENITIALSKLTGTVKIELKLPQQDINRSIDALQTGVVDKVKDKKSTLNTDIQMFSENVRAGIIEKSGLVTEETTIATSELLDTISTSTEELKGHVKTAESEVVESISKAEATLSDQIQNVTETIAHEIENKTTEINEKTVSVSSENKEHIQKTYRSLNEEIESGTENVIDNIKQETVNTKLGLQSLHGEYQKLVQHTVDAMKSLTTSLTKDDQLLLEMMKNILKPYLQGVSASEVKKRKQVSSDTRTSKKAKRDLILIPSKSKHTTEQDSHGFSMAAETTGDIINEDEFVLADSEFDFDTEGFTTVAETTGGVVDEDAVVLVDSECKSDTEGSFEPDDEIVQEVADVYDAQFKKVKAEVMGRLDQADEDVRDAAALKGKDILADIKEVAMDIQNHQSQVKENIEIEMDEAYVENAKTVEKEATKTKATTANKTEGIISEIKTHRSTIDGKFRKSMDDVNEDVNTLKSTVTVRVYQSTTKTAKKLDQVKKSSLENLSQATKEIVDTITKEGESINDEVTSSAADIQERVQNAMETINNQTESSFTEVKDNILTLNEEISENGLIEFIESAIHSSTSEIKTARLRVQKELKEFMQQKLSRPAWKN